MYRKLKVLVIKKYDNFKDWVISKYFSKSFKMKSFNFSLSSNKNQKP